jgi:UDP-glucuronate 4-epimerase
VRYVVTGAAGFIGSHLTETLQEQGHEVVGIDCFTDYYDVARKEENAAALDVLRLDLAEDELDFAGYDGVFHLAGQPGVRSFGTVFRDYARRNLVASQRVFEAAASTGVRVVFASSSSIYGDAETYPTPEDTQPLPISPYGITKLGCEHLARAYAQGFGLDAVALRYFTVYGPRQRPDMAFRRFCEAAVAGDPIVLYGDGRQTRDFTYVDDVVAALRAAAAAPDVGGRVFNVGGGSRASLIEVLDLLEELAGRPLEVRRRERESGDVMHTGADIAGAREALGFDPATTLEDGLRAELEWVRSRVVSPSRRLVRANGSADHSS